MVLLVVLVVVLQVDIMIEFESLVLAVDEMVVDLVELVHPHGTLEVYNIQEEQVI